MSCNETNNKPRTGRTIPLARFGWNVTQYNERRLFVSNHPELVNDERVVPKPSFPGNLLKHSEVFPASGVLHFRTFIWHGHAYKHSMNFILAATILGGSGSVSGHKREVQFRSEGLLYKAGMCCAKAQVLNSPLDPTGPSGNPTLADGVETPLSTFTVEPPGTLPNYVGAVDEFTVSGTPGAELRLRTVISEDTKLGDWASALLETDPAHPLWAHVRGCWPYCDIVLVAPYLVDLFTETNNPIGFEIGAATGADTNLFAANLGGPGATANKGLYGVNATYNVSFQNTSEPLQHYSLDSYLRARNILGKYFGAVYDVALPGIQPLGNLVSNQNATELVVGSDVGRIVPSFILNNATGGACGTPVDLVFSWIPLL